MIFPDVNVLVHAYNSQFPQHDQARDWWEGCMAGSVGIAFAWVTLLGFIRITTNYRIFTNPFTPAEALEITEKWLQLPQIMIVHPIDDHFQQLKASLKSLGTAGNLTTDAHLAAMAISRGLVLHTTDADFSRFPSLKWQNPLRKDY